MHSWSEHEYWLWVQKHGDWDGDEVLALFEKDIQDQVQGAAAPTADDAEQGTVSLFNTVLQRARQH